MPEYTGPVLSHEEWEKQFGKLPSKDSVVEKPTMSQTLDSLAQAATAPTSLFGLSPVEIAGAGVAGYGAVKAGLKARSILKSPGTIETEAKEAKPFIDVESREVPQAKPTDYSQPAYQRAGAASPFDVKQPVTPVVTPEVPAATQALQQRSEEIRAALAAQKATDAPLTSAIESGESVSQALTKDLAKEFEKTPDVTTEPATEETKTRKGRPKGALNLTPEQREMQQATKGINMYRNMLGFEKKYPESPKSLAAIQSADRLISEGFQGAIPSSRDPFLNPVTDLKASGEKFYSGLPEGYRNVYVPWLEKNLHTLPPETQSHVLESMTKGQTKDLGKIIKGLGIAGAALGAYETAFAQTPQDRALAGANLVGAVLPPGADIREAGAPTLPPDIKAKQEEIALLGSPYYETQEAKNLRQSKKVGAGRGIAPPSQYQR